MEDGTADRPLCDRLAPPLDGPALESWGRAEALRAAKSSIIGGLVGIAFWWLDGQLFLLVFGVLSLAMAVGRRVAPGRWLLLLTVLRSIAVALTFVVDILWHGASWWWAALVAFFLLLVAASIRKYRFFSPPPPPAW